MDRAFSTIFVLFASPREGFISFRSSSFLRADRCSAGNDNSDVRSNLVNDLSLSCSYFDDFEYPRLTKSPFHPGNCVWGVRSVENEILRFGVRITRSTGAADTVAAVCT